MFVGFLNKFNDCGLNRSSDGFSVPRKVVEETTECCWAGGFTMLGSGFTVGFKVVM